MYGLSKNRRVASGVVVGIAVTFLVVSKSLFLLVSSVSVIFVLILCDEFWATNSVKNFRGIL